jgi:hypothetical protein
MSAGIGRHLAIATATAHFGLGARGARIVWRCCWAALRFLTEWLSITLAETANA